MQYSAENLIRLARRDNNPVRPYLFVNPLQGKHIPADPAKTTDMCRALAEIVNRVWPGERLYVIGFAETATGIAAGVTAFLDNAVFFQHTTRECRDGGEALYFTESHSHATDQFLRAEGIRECLPETNRIVLIDDEVTTGNTMEKLTRVFRERFGAEGVRFGICSILNSMTEERLAGLKKQGIDCLYLARIPHEYRSNSVADVPLRPELHLVTGPEIREREPDVLFRSRLNPRGIVRFAEYRAEVQAFAEAIRRAVAEGEMPAENLLVIGTEEFMYPALMTGLLLQETGAARNVRVHATTRSPIVASEREGYPLTRRWQLRSLYDPLRTTYIYNLKKADRVVVVTDAPDGREGLSDLLSALENAGNTQITAGRWICR